MWRSTESESCAIQTQQPPSQRTAGKQKVGWGAYRLKPKEEHLQASEIPLLRQYENVSSARVLTFATLARGEFRHDRLDEHRNNHDVRVQSTPVFFEAGSDGEGRCEMFVREGPKLAEGRKGVVGIRKISCNVRAGRENG